MSNVTLWVDPANVDSYKTLVTGFEKKYPDVKVKVNQSPTGSANATPVLDFCFANQFKT